MSRGARRGWRFRGMGGAAVRGLCAAGAVGLAASANAAPQTASPAEEAVGAPAADAADDDLDAPEPPPLPDPAGAKRLPPPDRVWVDVPQKQVYVDGFISLREGYLEMFACKKGTKEHESIVALQANAYVIHAALLAVGALPGSPVKFQPKFAPPSGAEIEVEVRWLDAAGRWQSARAQQWIRDAKTGQPMQQPWVFAGSGMWKDEQSGKNYYMAEAGDVICVSNFGSAMLDVPVESSQSNEGLLFEANAEAIPPLGTPVRIVLTPKAGPPAGQPTAVGDKAAR